MISVVKRDGLTIEINPIPSGKLGIGKRPAGGIIECERCGRQEANAERDENGWELWYVSAEKAAASRARSFSPRTRAIPRTRG